MDHAAVTARLRAAGCVFAEDEADVLLSSAADGDELDAMVTRRAAGAPLEHVVGWAEFRGLRIVVDPGVFVPRRRTELMARHAARLAPTRATVLDLCCGTGAVGAAVVAEVEGATLYAADVDPAAVRCAHRNLDPLGARVYEGDLYAPLPSDLRGRVDVLLANVPYVPTGAVGLLPTEARVHEARVALDGGGDGMDVFRRVAADAPVWLAPGGHLLVETTPAQAPTACAVVTAAGLVAAVVRDDEADATVVTARRPCGTAA
jgi:release factor glutamine methyltransferase